MRVREWGERIKGQRYKNIKKKGRERERVSE